MAKVTHGDSVISVHKLEFGEVFSVFRLLTSDAPTEADFMSNYEAHRPPRKYERDWAIIHRAISTWSTQERAQLLAERVPQLNATHVARLDLRMGHGFNLAPTGKVVGHYSVWGAPVHLLAAMADIVSTGTSPT